MLVVKTGNHMVWEIGMERKLVSVLIPCYNEIENVGAISDAIIEQFEKKLPKYDYEIVFIDNYSTDGTREKLSQICAYNKNIKAIFNAKNFGQNNSPYYGLCQTTGDCTIAMACDFQDPVELIPRFIEEWEKGYKIVSGIKIGSDESKVLYFLRSCYYKLIRKMSSVEQIAHFTGYGLYDRSFIDVLRKLDDPMPFLRGIVAEFGTNRTTVEFHQPERRAGKTHNNWWTLYDIAMLSFTSYTKAGLRFASLVGFFIAALDLLFAFIYFIAKMIWWEYFPMGTAPLLIGMFFIGAVQLVFIGLLGEYVMGINTRVIHRPLVVEEKRINFE